MTKEFAFDPDMESTAEIDFVETRSGEPQLRRTWQAASAHASVLIVHGLAEHSGRYEHVARQLVASGFTVVSFDQRSHGRTGGGEGGVKAFSDLHDDLEDRLGEVIGHGLPVVLLGHSMGGLVVAGYAVDPARVQPGVIVLSSPVLGSTLPGPLGRIVSPVGRLLPGLKLKLPLDPDGLATDSRVGEKYVNDPDVHLRQPLGLVGAMFAAANDFQESGVSRWRADKALVVHGLDDEIVPPGLSEPIGEEPSVERVTYDGLRHEMFNEPVGPDILAEVIDWLGTSLETDRGAGSAPSDS